MKRKIVADSSCDMWELNGVDFAVAPMTISTDNKHYVDNQELDVHLMSEELAKYKGVSHTACPSVGSWLDCYEGYDEVFVVTLTGAMSGTYNSAMTAKGIYEEENENVKVHVFDSLSTGPEMRLLIEKLKEMISVSKSRLVTLDFLKEVFEIENIHIGKSIFVDAQGKFLRIWRDNIVLAYVPNLGESRTEYDPSFAFTVHKKDALKIDEYSKEGNKVKYIRATDIYTPFLVGAEAGYLISNVCTQRS